MDTGRAGKVRENSPDSGGSLHLHNLLYFLGPQRPLVSNRPCGRRKRRKREIYRHHSATGSRREELFQCMKHNQGQAKPPQWLPFDYSNVRAEEKPPSRYQYNMMILFI